MKTPHTHAELLHAIADGGLEAAREFECRTGSNRMLWLSITFDSLTHVLIDPHGWQVRRKPRTVKIGNREVQAGTTEAPLIGTPVWVVDITAPVHIRHVLFVRGDYCERSLKRGLVHLSEEPARAMGEALAIVAKGEE